LIGNLIPDLIVDEGVIVDPKVVACFTDTHVAQMLGYLNITELDLALLLNLRTLDWNRNGYCAREKLANTRHPIFMPESYACYRVIRGSFEIPRKLTENHISGNLALR